MSELPVSARYVGRFAPSPTGPLHAGSLVAALASWLDARAWTARTGQRAQWLVRIEDIDPPRCEPGADTVILAQLQRCGLLSDGPVVYQSQRQALYEAALQQLIAQDLAYPCGCTRREIAQALAAQGVEHTRHAEWPYPGTCRDGLHGKPARAWRLRAMAPERRKEDGKRALPYWDEHGICQWDDRRLGPQQQDVQAVVGDFVLRRADGLWAYQLAVVVDDGDQGVTHITRGEDLTDNTPRQLLLQRRLGLPHPRYLHTPLVRTADGEKLSKQHGAPAVDLSDPVAALCRAAEALQLPLVPGDTSLGDALSWWVQAWQTLYNRGL